MNEAHRAVAEAERELERDPGNMEARFKLAAAMRHAGRHHDAARMYLAIARVLQAKGEIARAHFACQTAVEILPKDPEAKSLLDALTREAPKAAAVRAVAAPPPIPSRSAPASVSLGTGSTPAGGAVEFRAPARASTSSEDDKSARLTIAERTAFGHSNVAANVSFRRPRARRATRAHGSEVAPAPQPPPPPSLSAEIPRNVSARLPHVLAEVSRGMNLKSFSRGEMILREGDPGSSLFLIATGNVRILKHDRNHPGKDLVPIAELGAGEVFGEFAVVADSRRHATVQATADTHVYEIPRQLLTDLTRTYPEVGEHLRNYYRERLLASLVTSSWFVHAVPEAERKAVLDKFEAVRVESETFVVTEGELASGFYVVLLGSVDVLKATGPQSANVIASLREGEHFGTLSLLRGIESPCSVMASGPGELARLPLPAFYDLVGSHPALWDRLRTESFEREALLGGP